MALHHVLAVDALLAMGQLKVARALLARLREIALPPSIAQHVGDGADDG